MLVNNFSAGILAGILTLIAFWGIGPVVEGLNNVLAAGVETIVNAGMLAMKLTRTYRRTCHYIKG